jgi:hypothetical protein
MKDSIRAPLHPSITRRQLKLPLGFLAGPATKTLSIGGSLAFGNVAIATSATLTITNTGTAPLTITGISYPTGFTGAWTGSLAPANTEKVTVTFTPTAASSYGGDISVTSNATGSPTTVAVSGAGVNPVTASLVTPPASSLITFSQWQAQDGIVSGPNVSSQSDGVPNLLKYLVPISPTAPMSAAERAALPAVAIDTTTTPGTTYLPLNFRKNALATGITVNLQSSANLQAGQPSHPTSISKPAPT